VVLGYLSTLVISVIEGAVVVGGLSAFGAALVGMGIPKNSVIKYETALTAESFLIIGHGSEEDMERARVLLETTKPIQVDLQKQVKTTTSNSKINEQVA
jgi:hypothetical protein